MVDNLTLFYHFFVCPDERGLFWNWWLDEQAGAMKQAQVPNVQMYVTMPKYWNSINGIHLIKNKEHYQITLEEKLVEYVNLRYPFLNIAGIRDTGEQNLYEGYTLFNLWKNAQVKESEYCGYVHTKGVMSLGVQTSCWRQYLNKKFITEWKDRYIDLLQGHDVIAVVDKQCDGTVVSGNFFYARNEYIKTLEEPIYGNDRYQYEKWILSGNPKLKIVDNTHIDHFKDIYIGT